MTGLIYLVCSVLFSLAIAQVLKFVEIRSLRTLQVLVINYIAAFLVAFFSTEWEGITGNVNIFPILILSMIVGAFFITNFLVYSKSIDRNGMGISITAMRMSLVIPIAVSLFAYGERVSVIQATGIGISFLALFLLIPSMKRKDLKDWRIAFLPLLLFLFTGFGESGLKVFEREFMGDFNESHFLSGVFGTAFIIGVITILIRKQRSFSWQEVVVGIVLGVFNLYSSHFLILALNSYPGSVVFPVVNLATIVLGTAIGLWFWKDKVSLKQWVGLGLASISIYLLL